MAGKTLAEVGLTEEIIPNFYSVKEAVFPFAKFPGVDPILGPEMKSTGEVMGVGDSFAEAFAKARVRAAPYAYAIDPSGEATLALIEADPVPPGGGEPILADGDWVGRLLDRFAEYYFDSIDGGPEGRPVPSPWVLAHAAAIGAPLMLLGRDFDAVADPTGWTWRGRVPLRGLTRPAPIPTG